MAIIPLPFVVTVALVFFSLTLSNARIPANIPGDEVSGVELPSSLPESDANPIIRLPSDAESHSNEPARETQKQESETVKVQTVPFGVVRFRPVDHRFRLRSRFPFRCRHHHHHHRMFMPTIQHRQIPYGDDMILTNGEVADFHPGMVNGGIRRIPARWVKIHHHSDDEDDNDGIQNLMFKHSDVFDKEKFEKHKHHHHDDDEEDKEEKFKKHKNGKEGGGFMKRIRKILDHF